MAVKNSRRSARKSKTGGGFRFTDGHVATLDDAEAMRNLGEALGLPRVQGPPVLFAIARDPQTIFAYWDVDWPSTFRKSSPLDRQVHLRVIRENGAEEASAAAEPMAGNSYVTVSETRGPYRVEIGYFQPEDVWNFVATSDWVTMPPDRVSENFDVDLATIPFHIGFQRLVDLVRVSKGNGVAEIISRLQRRALSDEDRAALGPEEWEILRAMDLSLDEIESARRAFVGGADTAALRKRAEAILGFGSTSPAGGFGESSWVSVAS